MRISFTLVLASVSSHAFAQSAIEHRSWQDPYPLVPLSRTAEAITGLVRVTENSISFNGMRVPSRLEGRYWRPWGFDRQNHTGSVYELAADPGQLRQGNTLCGDTDTARYIVLWESHDGLAGPAVNMAVWSSSTVPIDGDSPGLCGTYSYVLRMP